MPEHAQQVHDAFDNTLLPLSMFLPTFPPYTMSAICQLAVPRAEKQCKPWPHLLPPSQLHIQMPRQVELASRGVQAAATGCCRAHSSMCWIDRRACWQVHDDEHECAGAGDVAGHHAQEPGGQRPVQPRPQPLYPGRPHLPGAQLPLAEPCSCRPVPHTTAVKSLHGCVTVCATWQHPAARRCTSLVRAQCRCKASRPH